MIEDKRGNESRRKFLKTAGKFAVYTPPALMLMSSANAKYVAESAGDCKPGIGSGDTNHCHSGAPGQNK
jgi:hypothetical protein